MYIDQNAPPVVTCGIGHALFKSTDAIALPFHRSIDGVKADPSLIAVIWSKLKYQPPPYKTMHDISLVLSDDAIDALAIQDATRFEPIMSRTFPSFGMYPEDVQLALWDMVWQCGSFVKWPNFTAAVKSSNWEEAARQCNRPQASKSRNDDTRALFLAAAQQDNL